MTSRSGWSRMLRGAASAILVLAAASACVWGMTPARYASTMDPSGSRATVTLVTGARFSGELFVADTQGVIVRGERLVRIGWPSVRHVQVLRPTRLVVSGSSPEAVKHELALYSRHPHGLSPELLARILAAVGQDSLEVVR